MSYGQEKFTTHRQAQLTGLLSASIPRRLPWPRRLFIVTTRLFIFCWLTRTSEKSVVTHLSFKEEQTARLSADCDKSNSNHRHSMHLQQNIPSLNSTTTVFAYIGRRLAGEIKLHFQTHQTAEGISVKMYPSCHTSVESCNWLKSGPLSNPSILLCYCYSGIIVDLFFE